jgi:AbiV family abortive infection protein
MSSWWTDAETLLKAERWARAFALATFAVEETGKAWLADQTIAFDPKRRIKRVHHIGKRSQPAKWSRCIFYCLVEDP